MTIVVACRVTEVEVELLLAVAWFNGAAQPADIAVSSTSATRSVGQDDGDAVSRPDLAAAGGR